ncbi:hypothetical protein [Deinococcus sp.]|uniref:hypothetical protein n=1 Tax=Deinococcus sp. TaxID=47478 RepID=UPI003CC699A7
MKPLLSLLAALSLSACAPVLGSNSSAVQMGTVPDLTGFTGTWEGQIFRRDDHDTQRTYTVQLNNYGGPVVGKISYQNCLANLVSPVRQGNVLTLSEQPLQGPCLGGSFRLYLLEEGQEVAYVSRQLSSGRLSDGPPNSVGYLDQQQ